VEVNAHAWYTVLQICPRQVRVHTVPTLAHQGHKDWTLAWSFMVTTSRPTQLGPLLHWVRGLALASVRTFFIDEKKITFMGTKETRGGSVEGKSKGGMCITASATDTK
jgi:hypothetical protein